MSIDRLSERVGPTGSLQGEGLANILGRPAFDPLTLALREAGQNIWDARIRTGERQPPRMLVRLRNLTPDQGRAFRGVLSVGDRRDSEPAARDELAKCLASTDPIRVLEICDFGTRGLEGSTDPRSARANFVRFFFDIGSAHFEGGDGGTYGYGRSSLYLAGAAQTIVVDSLLHECASRRLMACRIGHSYEKPSIGGGISRFTGRHFWGVRNGSDGIGPVEGVAARDLALTLGMPERSVGESGTTIMIPWPDIRVADSGRHIAQILLHNLWPKLVSKEGKLAMLIEVEEDGQEIEVPDPSTHPHYSLFADALLVARTRREDVGASAIEVRRPSTVTTGHIAFATSQRERASSSENELRPELIFSSGVHHVALMRPSELVVRYMDFPLAGEAMAWAGVFICSDEPEVRTAFAASEPPAHDDWVPDRLDGYAASWVRVTTTKRIPEAVNRKFGTATSNSADQEGGQHSLAGAADRFSSQFLSGDGSAPGSTSQGGDTVSPANGPRIKPIRFEGLRLEDGARIARFRTAITGEGSLRVNATAVVDGLGSDDLVAEVARPVIQGWEKPDGTRVPGQHCVMEEKGDYFFDVVFMGQYAVIPSCDVVGD